MDPILEGIRAERRKAVEELYNEYRVDFIKWMISQFDCDEETALDVFQESVITLYVNIKNGRYDESKASIKTYLFSLGKYTLFNKKRKVKMEINTDLEDFISPSWELNLFEKDVNQQYIKHALTQIGSKCRSILTLFYFDNFSMEAIAEKVGLKNEKVVKSQKLRCLKSLRDIVFNRKNL